MAIYRLETKNIGRANGQCAIKAAAYRAGERLLNRDTGQVVDYSKQAARVAFQQVLAPEGTHPDLLHRETLWNIVTASERRHDARLAREFLLSLPHELDANQRQALVLAFVTEHLVAHGMVADVCIHRPDVVAGNDERNHHAHVLTTLRQAGPHGLRPVKTREWNSRQMLEHWREAWAEHVNRALERAGRVERVDHRSLGRQCEDAWQRADIKTALQTNRKPEPYVPHVAYRKPWDVRSLQLFEKKMQVLRENAAKAHDQAERARNARALFLQYGARHGAPPDQATAKALTANLFADMPLFTQDGDEIPRDWILNKILAERPLFGLIAWFYTNAQLLEELRAMRKQRAQRRWERHHQRLTKRNRSRKVWRHRKLTPPKL